MSKEDKIKVSKETRHVKTEVSKWVYIYEFFRRLTNIFLGSFISYKLYFDCLKCNDCNSIVVVYFCLLSLAFFINAGVPVNKLVKINSVP